MGILDKAMALLAACGMASYAQAQSARVEIGPVGGNLNASTYASGSFVLENLSGTTKITSVRFDLSTAVFPDLIFDPFGTGGDTVAKDFTPDSGAAATGLGAHSFDLPNGGGFNALDIAFSDFDPGEIFTFSVDVDPTSIQGSSAPGPGESGSVSGLELIGSTITVTFDDATVLVGKPQRMGASLSASEATLTSTSPAAPLVEVVGLTTPDTVFQAAQTVRITGTPGSTVSLVQLEGALFTDGLVGGGFDIDPFEANSAVAVDQMGAVVGPGGTVDIAVSLDRSVPEGGIVHFVASEQGGGGTEGPTSVPAVVVFQMPGPVSFSKRNVPGVGLTNPTSLQFGPDDRLYVAEQAGLIKAYTVTRSNSFYSVSNIETIDLVNTIPNHDDDGTLNPAITTRQITGILVVGTPAEPVIYVGSSDPRIGGGGQAVDTGLDTNSGVISRLTKVGGSWQKLDLVRGLPRSEENHSVNGLQLDAATNTLYATVGGNTNMGAPSNNFTFLPEFALSAAILAIDLDAIGNTTYDLPTLDDEDRPGTPDANDPFGGNNGKNQAQLVIGGPVQIHSPGWRNPYDVLITESGRMYSVDNGPNAGWGDIPTGRGTCTNDISEPGVTYGDGLHFISGPGYYAGHPNPTRASMSNTFNPTNPQTPVPFDNPVECNYGATGSNGSLADWPASTNGLCEYRASFFGAEMRGDLLTVTFNNQLQRVKLNAAGDQAILVETLVSSLGSLPLDVVAQGDADVFPGTIWVVNYGSGEVTVFDPEMTGNCTAAYDLGLDEDDDGYSNADEIDNGSDPCSSADVPPDYDGDFVSDLNDDDDDNDGVLDVVDAFAIDAANGLNNYLPTIYTWDNDEAVASGFLGLGFTGLMGDGVTDYLDLFDPENMTAGGAAGVMTVDEIPAGTAVGAQNDQLYGFQFGVHVTPETPRFRVRTRILAPFGGLTPDPEQSMGLFIGTGDQDNFARVVVNGSGIEFLSEVGGSTGAPVAAPLTVPGRAYVDLILDVDPGTGLATPKYAIPGANPVAISGPQALPIGWFDGVEALAVGTISTSGTAGVFAATWDFIEAVPVSSFNDVIYRVNAGGPTVPALDGGLDWIPDAGFVSNAVAFNSGVPTIPSSSVPATTPDEVFESERFDAPGGSVMTWEFPVSASDVYEVRLYFAEVFAGAYSTGARVFDVMVEGQPTLSGYDIYKELGSEVGGMKTIYPEVTDGSITITFAHDVENPKISAIEILEGDPSGRTLGNVLPYGGGLGSANIGVQSISTVPTIGKPILFELSQMGSGPAAILVLSIAKVQVPLFGGTLLVNTNQDLGWFVVPVVSGSGSLMQNVPNDASLVGFTSYSQAAIKDTTVVGNWRFTNGLEILMGN